ncbi:hypothetical protein LXA43DRAFT_1053134 [Ganoderma leucocontextum]|nr:hypothetical protein LXA43DRAFT_1053134 [Ganoderma leucocontextum]
MNEMNAFYPGYGTVHERYYTRRNPGTKCHREAELASCEEEDQYLVCVYTITVHGCPALNSSNVSRKDPGTRNNVPMSKADTRVNRDYGHAAWTTGGKSEGHHHMKGLTLMAGFPVWLYGQEPAWRKQPKDDGSEDEPQTTSSLDVHPRRIGSDDRPQKETQENHSPGESSARVDGGSDGRPETPRRQAREWRARQCTRDRGGLGHRKLEGKYRPLLK